MTYESNRLAIYHGYMAKNYGENYNDYLMHYGIRGQRWGIRRWQNEDGSLTEAGRKHYGLSTESLKNELSKRGITPVEGIGNVKFRKKYDREMKKTQKLAERTDVELQNELAGKYDKRAKAAIKIAGVGAATALGGLGTGEAIRSIYRNKSYEDINDISKKYFQNKLDKAEAWAISKDNYLQNLRKSGEKGNQEAERLLPIFKEEFEKKQNAVYDEYDKIRSSKDPAGELANNSTEAKIAKGIKYAGAAVAVGAGGAAAYNKAKAIAAKRRTTEYGHAKAVVKAYEQYEKMSKTFANTPYMSLFKEQIEAYKKEHPNTALSDKEIFKNLT